MNRAEYDEADCLLCKRAVALSVWAHYGHPEGPWASPLRGRPGRERSDTE
jgi:hypothetical protein